MSEHVPQAHPVDQHVGRRIRLRRNELGVSQQGLADGLNLTFQQVQKYERGSNRVSASKLYEIAGVLRVPMAFFFDGLDDPASPGGERHSKAWSRLAENLLSEPDGQALAEAFLSIRRRSVRKGLADLARLIATNDNPKDKPEGRLAAE